MALFQAFRAVRPAPERAAQVAALPYDVVSREEAREIGEKNPESFLHVDRAEMDLDPAADLYDPKVYEKAKENLDRFQDEGILIQDKKPNYYLYELIRKGKSQERKKSRTESTMWMYAMQTQALFFLHADIRRSFLH